MRLEQLKTMDPQLRTFVLMIVGLSYPAWDVGFELGVYGEVFFEKILAAWSTSVALLATFLLAPRLRGLLTPLGWVALATPSVWLLFLSVFRSLPTHEAIGFVLFGLGFLTYVACFPYALYLGISVVYPDLLSVKDMRARLSLLFLIVFLLAAGFGIGHNHRLFLTCQDFEVSGNAAPPDCRPVGELPLAR